MMLATRRGRKEVESISRNVETREVHSGVRPQNDQLLSREQPALHEPSTQAFW